MNEKQEENIIRTIRTYPREKYVGPWESGRLYPLYNIVSNNGSKFVSINGKMKEEPYVIYNKDTDTFTANEGWELREMSADSRITAVRAGASEISKHDIETILGYPPASVAQLDNVILTKQDKATAAPRIWERGLEPSSAQLTSDTAAQKAVGMYAMANGARSAEGIIDTNPDYETYNFGGSSPNHISFYGNTFTHWFEADPEGPIVIEDVLPIRAGSVVLFNDTFAFRVTEISESTGIPTRRTYTINDVFPNMPTEGTIRVYTAGAIGFASHVEGIGTIALNEGEYAGGKYNETREGMVFSIGCGTDRYHRANVFQVIGDEIYIKGVGKFGVDAYNYKSIAQYLSSLEDRISELESQINGQ